MYSSVRRWPQSLKKLKIRKLTLGLLISDILKWTSSPIPIPPLSGHLQSQNLSLCCFGVSRMVPPFFPPSVHFLTLPSPTLLYASLWMWHRGTMSPPLSCPEVLVELRESCAVGLFITMLKNGRMASLQEQMALYAWHNFLKLGPGLQILAFACYSNSYQNITMKIRYFCRKGVETYFFQRFKITRVEVS